MIRARSALAVVLLLGCASDERTNAPSDAPRGARRLPSEEVAATKTTAAAPSTAQPPAPEVEKPVVDAKVPEKPKRDYGAELLAAVGSPVHCLKPRTGPDVPSEIRIDLDATVVELGLVTRAYARSSHLDADELKCVEQQLANVRMRGPVEEAPRSVRTTVVLQQQRPADKAEPADRRDGYGERNDATGATPLAPAPAPPGPT